MRRTAALVAGVSTVILAYYLVVRPWHRHWGASDAEVARRMPGDEQIVRPVYVTTRAVTIDAPPESIWPLLAQIGTGNEVVLASEPNQYLVLGSRTRPEWRDTWVLALYPTGRGATRLVSRTRVWAPPASSDWWLLPLRDPGQFIRERKTLLELKDRAADAQPGAPADSRP